MEDRALAHLQVVITTKLRRGEGFLIQWDRPAENGSGRGGFWIHPNVDLTFEYDGGREPSLDLGDPLQAEGYFEVGRAAGREAEDDALAAWVLTTQSIGPFYTGDLTQAVELLDQAAHLVAHSGSPRREAWVNAMAARAHAALGHHDLTHTALDRSAARLAEADSPAGIDFFDPARLVGIAGSCHLHLRDTTTSAQKLSTAIHSRAPTDAKGRALLVFDLAQCRIAEGEIEEACHLANSALDLASDSIVRPIADRARAIRHDLGQWGTLGPVAAFTARLRETPTLLPGRKD